MSEQTREKIYVLYNQVAILENEDVCQSFQVIGT